MLKAHKYYVYHDDNKVFARMEDKEPILLKEFETSGEAYTAVQSVLNPDSKDCLFWGPEGFNSKAFQESISGSCEKIVKAAYGVK